MNEQERLALRTLDDRLTLRATRRQFFGNALGSAGGLSLGSIALASLLSEDAAGAAPSPPTKPAAFKSPLAPRPPHFEAKAKRVIFLFMAGGPSQLELFDYKPKLQELDGQTVPDEYTKGKRFAFLKGKPKLVGTRRKFTKHGECGMELGESLPHLGSVADDITLIRGMKTDVFNHGPAKLFLNSGFPQFSGLLWSSQWLYLATLETLLLTDADTEARQAALAHLQTRFADKLQRVHGSFVTLPTDIPTMPAIAAASKCCNNLVSCFPHGHLVGLFLLVKFGKEPTVLRKSLKL